MKHFRRAGNCVPLLLLAAACGFSAVGRADGNVRPAHETQEWPETRVLTWADPGKDGQLGAAANWLEHGVPAKTAPDRETDIVLPAAPKQYKVTGGRANQVRHVRIEMNAALYGGHRNEVEIWGNVDVKKGGDIHFISIRGDRHTYFRIEDADFPNKETGRTYRHCNGALNRTRTCSSQISHKFQIYKIGTASVEFLGNVGVSDEVMVQHGKCIISGDFRYSGATNKGAFEVYDGGILELQSGGRLVTLISDNRKGVYNVNVYRNGVLQAGSPERPLTSDAYLCLGFAENDRPGRSGLYAALGSFLRVYSSDPQKARLVVTANQSLPDFRDGNGRPVGSPDEKAAGNRGVALQLAGDVQLDGVVFDYIMEGGIALLDPATFQSSKHVSFGPHCAAPPDGLLARMEADPNSYYHGRGDQKSEFGLTEKAVRSMGKYLDEYDPFQLATVPENTRLKTVGRGGNAIRTPVAVIFNGPIEVKITTRVPGARIRYTTDGTEPTADSPAYTGPIKLNKTTKLMIKAYKKGVGFSPTCSTVYVLK